MNIRNEQDAFPSMEVLRIPALRISQGRNRQLFSLAIEGKQISKIASITRIKRGTEELSGYQRPEIVNHIREIRQYIESDNPMIPNPVIIAFDQRVVFEPVEGSEGFGYLVIPVSDKIDFEKPGFIVDGQQRTAALRETSRSGFMMPVSAFIASNHAEQREQFMLVNSTKPLPKTLLYELAPYTEGRLPSDLQQKKFPSRIMQKLNFEPGPLYLRIKTATNQAGKGKEESMKGIIADNSILRMIDSSLRDGALHRFRDPNTGEGEEVRILGVLNNFWLAVSKVFPYDWNLPPKQSRLLHGAGVAALGSLMDEIDAEYMHQKGVIDETNQKLITPMSFFVDELETVKPYCHWSSGFWNLGHDVDGNTIRKRWDEIQNLSRDIVMLSDFLVHAYRGEIK